MKQSTFFFLTLVLAAAIITGSTLGVISNFENIKTAVQNQPVANVANTEASEREEISPTGNGPSSSQATVQTALAPTGSNSTELMVISPEDGAEITSMLVQLGMTGETDSTEFIKQYQQTRGIQPTGNIDSMTLNSIIKDVKQQRASQLAKP